MIFEELVLHNFGIYKGRHAIALRPNEAKKSIILFGALNGGGKTTFLDALQLALYGKFASCSNRGALSYPDFLLRAINSSVSPSEGAGLELEFTRGSHDSMDRYRVIRTWRSTGKGVKEDLEVFRNGVFDPLTTERWYEVVEEIIPSNIAELFFFDGEKIESLADQGRAAQLLRTGIYSLLGLDSVDQLSKDLSVLESRRLRNTASTQDQAALSNLDNELGELESRRRELVEQIASQQNDLDSLSKREESVRQEFRREGGELLDRRESLEAERRATAARLNDAEDKLRDLAAGIAPFLLVSPLLQDIAVQAAAEHHAELLQELDTELAARDTAMFAYLKANKVPNEFLQTVQAFQQQDAAARGAQQQVTRYLHTDPNALASVRPEELASLRDQIETALKRFHSIRDDLLALDRQVASIPDPDALAGITDRLNQTISQRDSARISNEAAKLDLERVRQAIESKTADRQRILELAAREEVNATANQRVITHTQKVRSTLASFKSAVVAQHSRRLESLILESFRSLIRKKSLVERITIDPDTFVITLRKATGQILPPERLSAGERQLFAVSILWGLAKASGRPLPTIIDTPLARMDGIHRKNLLEAYFPFASHQVILLSTDEEIDRPALDVIRAFVSRTYLIEYSDALNTSAVRPGYFWN